MTFEIKYAVLNNDGTIKRIHAMKQDGNTSIDAVMKAFDGCPQHMRNRFELVSVEKC